MLQTSPVQPAYQPAQLTRPHSLAGSDPAGMLVHVPTLPATLHAWQSDPHELLQQKPSAQANPPAQSDAAAHVCP
ncbi:MAG: hypothetical protein IPG17_16845 [Sandaracinaceae bacterium]|nr:hypothetical protein [Sandaracinaceae bacterium]